MAEANFTDLLERKNHKDSSHMSTNNQSPEGIISVPDQSKSKSDYHENLLAIPNERVKGNLKEKLVPHLEGKNLSTESSFQNEGNAIRKIQNTDSLLSSSRLNNIGMGAGKDNKDKEIFLTSANILEPVQDPSSHNSNNASHSFDVTKNEQYKNYEGQMNDSLGLQLIGDYSSDSDCEIVEVESAQPSGNIITAPNDNGKDFLNDYRAAQALFSDDDVYISDSSDDKSDSDSSSSTSSSSSSSGASSIAAENASAVARNNCNNAQSNASKTKNNSLLTRGEITIEDLPPIEDLCISVPEQECVEVGKITNIVDQLVVVQAFKNSPPLDLDSILFLDQGKRPLGQIFDVFGQVSEPLYCVRFNSGDHIKEKGVEKDMMVYCAPKTKHTSYVFLPHLLQMKGSDASWEDNNEPPEKCLDYSDDEEEQRARRAKKSNDKKTTEESADHPKKKRTRSNSFERRMNERNLRMTALHANLPPATPFRNNNNSSSNNSSSSRPAFDNAAWWTSPVRPNYQFHRPNRPLPPLCTPPPQRLIQPPTFTLPPPQRFDMQPYFSSPPPTFSSPHNAVGAAFSNPRGTGVAAFSSPHGTAGAGFLSPRNTAGTAFASPRNTAEAAFSSTRNTAAAAFSAAHNTVAAAFANPLNTAGAAFSSPHSTAAGAAPVPPLFSPFQAPPFLPFHQGFPPPIPPFDPNRPPPTLGGFPPSFPPQVPRHRPPPPP